MHLPSPKELGFPAPLVQWRPSQLKALTALLNNTLRIMGLNAPTGFGKTAVCIAYALLSEKPTCIVTPNRGLQVQAERVFGCVGLVTLMGRRNYPCHFRPHYSCEEGYATRCPHKGTTSCPSSYAELQAATSMLVMTNYDKWTSSRKFGTGMEHFQQVIFDEGDQAPLKLASALQVELFHKEMDQLLDMTLPDSEEMVDWRAWAGPALARAKESYADAVMLVRTGSAGVGDVKEMLHLKNLVKRLTTIAHCRPENWVVDRMGDDRGYVLDPIRVGRYTEPFLFFDIPKVLLVGASLVRKTFYMLGVPKAKYAFLQMASDFNPARCPIYYVPVMRVDSRTKDLRPLWLKLDQIAARRQDRKGIVNPISFARRDEILAASRFAPKMLINTRGEAPSSMIEQFKQSPPGTILVSPSVGSGYDFPLKECEWILMCKIPFPHTTKIMRARQVDDPEYGFYIAMSQLEQNAGRGMRMAQDQCETFLLDAHGDWFLYRYKHLASPFFFKRIQRLAILPAPLPALR